MGTNVVRPQPEIRPEYVVIFRFDGYENLKTWMTSNDREYWLARVRPSIASDPQIQQISGIEACFSIPGRALQTPPRYKMALLTWGLTWGGWGVRINQPLESVGNAFTPEFSRWDCIPDRLWYYGCSVNLHRHATSDAAI